MSRSLLLVASLLVAACSEGDAGQRAAKAAAPAALPVGVVETALRQVPVTFEAVGRTEGSRETSHGTKKTSGMSRSRPASASRSAATTR